MPSSSPAATTVLAVVAHPDRASLTWRITEQIGAGVTSSDGALFHTIDLNGEGFSPVFLDSDRRHFRDGSGPTEDVRRQQEMIDAADALVVIFPVYWWSMPAVLKGWFDRVFVRDWAYRIDPQGRDRGALGDRSMHLVAVAGASEAMYNRHGYSDALHTQVAHGILEYCGVVNPTSHVIYHSEDPSLREQHLQRATQIGVGLFELAEANRQQRFRTQFPELAL